MQHFEIHKLERRIADLLKKNFSRTPSPHEKSYDYGDFLQMGHDVTDMLLGEYWIDSKEHPHPMLVVDTSLSKALESTAFGLERLAKALNEWVMKDTPESPKTVELHKTGCPCDQCSFHRVNHPIGRPWMGF